MVLRFNSGGVWLVPQLEVLVGVAGVEVAGELARGGKPLPRGGRGVPAVVEGVQTDEVTNLCLL